MCCSHLRNHACWAAGQRSGTAVIDFTVYSDRLGSLWPHSRWYFSLVLSVQFSITAGTICFHFNDPSQWVPTMRIIEFFFFKTQKWMLHLNNYIFCCVKVKTCPFKKNITPSQKAFWGHRKVEKVILTHFTHSSKAASPEGDYIICPEWEVLVSVSLRKMGGREPFVLWPVSFWFRYVVIGGFSDPNGFPEVFWVWRCKPDQVKRICNWSNFNKAVTLP